MSTNAIYRNLIDTISDKIIKKQVYFYKEEIKPNEVNSCIESNGVLFSIDNIKSEDFMSFPNINLKKIEVIARYFSGDFSVNKIDNYDMDFYSGTVFQHKKILERIMEHSNTFETRKLIICFDKYHCFQFIQFNIRKNKNSIVIETNASMRSCNLSDNFIYDLYIVYLLSKDIKDLYKNSKINISLFLGSLHLKLDDMIGKIE